MKIRKHELRSPDVYGGEFDSLLKRILVPIGFKKMIDGLEIDDELKARLKQTFVESLAQAKVTPQNKSGYQPHTETSKRYIEAAKTALIDSKNSRFSYPISFSELKKELDAGANIILVANHKSGGADGLALYAAVEHANPQKDFHQHLLTITAKMQKFPVREAAMNGFDRICVYTDKQLSGEFDKRGSYVTLDEGKKHNIRAIKSLITQARDGGRLVLLFPEGGVNPEGLGKIPKSSGQIIEAINKNSLKGCIIYPVYIDGTQDIFSSFRSIARGGQKMSRKAVTVNVGKELRFQKKEGGEDMIERTVEAIKRLKV